MYRHQNVSLTLAIVADCRRMQGGRNQGSSQLTVWQWLTCVECKCVECMLTSRTTNSKNRQKGDKIPATIQNFRRRQERYRPKQKQPTLSGPFFYDDVGVALLIDKSMRVWFRAHAHKNYTN